MHLSPSSISSGNVPLAPLSPFKLFSGDARFMTLLVKLIQNSSDAMTASKTVKELRVRVLEGDCKQWWNENITAIPQFEVLKPSGHITLYQRNSDQQLRAKSLIPAGDSERTAWLSEAFALPNGRFNQYAIRQSTSAERTWLTYPDAVQGGTETAFPTFRWKDLEPSSRPCWPMTGHLAGDAFGSYAPFYFREHFFACMSEHHRSCEGARWLRVNTQDVVREPLDCSDMFPSGTKQPPVLYVREDRLIGLSEEKGYARVFTNNWNSPKTEIIFSKLNTAGWTEHQIPPGMSTPVSANWLCLLAYNTEGKPFHRIFSLETGQVKKEFSARTCYAHLQGDYFVRKSHDWSYEHDFDLFVEDLRTGEAITIQEGELNSDIDSVAVTREDGQWIIHEALRA